jgi:ribose transport system permease protein
VLGTQSALFVLALAALLPATVGDLDLSLGFAGALSAMSMAVLNTHRHWSIVPAALVAVLIGAACGFFNGLVVVKFKTDPFIMTLGTGALFGGLLLKVAHSNTITGVAASLSDWTYGHRIWVIPIQFFYALGLMLVIWYVAEHTPLGIRALFVGKSRDVARLSGIASDRIRWGAFTVAGALAALAAVIFVGNSSSIGPTGFSPYLLPAYAAVFLGATTIRPGRFNPLGTGIAVLFLATGVNGLQILKTDDYTQQLFYGAVLIVAVAFSRYLRRN